MFTKEIYMADKITGKVEIIMTNKFNSDKYAMKLEGNDTWFGQSKEWMEVVPDRGDVVEFSGGKTGKYIQYLTILEKAAPTAAPAAKSGGKAGFNALGVELGHAANNAVALAVAEGITDLDAIKAKTRDFYEMMRDLRSEYEGEQEAPKKAAKKAKPKAESAPVQDVDEDDPF